MTTDKPRASWHAEPVEEVVALLGTGPEGLSSGETRSRLALYGPNQLPEEAPPSALELLVRQMRSPLIYILIVAFLVTLALAEYIDAGVIAAVLIINSTIGFVQERQADRSVRALGRLLTPVATVVRDGQTKATNSRELVPGDRVQLETGQHVPADLRIAASNGLLVDESLLTGESEPTAKQPDPVEAAVPPHDRTNMVYTGTTVVRGRGFGYVVATGTRTQVGEIATHMREAALTTTPLQRHVARLSQIIGIVVAVAALIAFGIGIAAGETVNEMFLVAVALAVSAVPEGLPVAFTITLALGVRRMAERDAIVRQLPAVETLGSTTVIGSDKTGTLTQNRMAVQRIWTADEQLDVPSRHAPLQMNGAHLGKPTPLDFVLLAGALANEAEIHSDATTGDAGFGDPTELALLTAASNFGRPPATIRSQYPVHTSLPFEPERQYSAVVVRLAGDQTNQYLTLVKGAPERLGRFCTRIATRERLVEFNAASVEEAAESMARDGQRVLAMAYRFDKEPPADLENLHGLTFAGMQGLIDPPRVGVEDAIQGCRDAGIRVLMITGDHATTAMAIGSRIGLDATPDTVMSGIDVEPLSDSELRDRVRTTSIYARVTPEQKLRIVQALRDNGEIVAVTGDGVNDAPALRAADIGVAMGLNGTDVAREAADMVLTDDDFTSIYDAVREGRVTFDNLRKVTFFLVATNVAEILAVLTALTLGWPLPFRPAQILWLNLVTEGVQDVALAFEPGESGVVHRQPRPAGEGIINRVLWERTLIAGIVMTVGTLLLFRWQTNLGTSLAQAQTVALTTMVMFEAVQVFNARTTGSIFRSNPLSNPFLLVATLAALGLHIGALYFPPTQTVLRVEPLPLSNWAWIILVSLSIILFMELHKFLRRDRRQPSEAAMSH
ncbi:MAG: HAD-IC family P-type ATPase [Thermomicrobiales bacterium]